MIPVSTITHHIHTCTPQDESHISHRSRFLHRLPWPGTQPPSPSSPSSASLTIILLLLCPSQYQNWDTTDPATLFSAPTVKQPSSKGIVHHLSAEGKVACCWWWLLVRDDDGNDFHKWTLWLARDLKTGQEREHDSPYID